MSIKQQQREDAQSVGILVCLIVCAISGAGLVIAALIPGSIPWLIGGTVCVTAGLIYAGARK